MDETPKIKGKQVKRFVLTVTPEDIEQAVPRDSSACLIAQAVHRQYPEARNIDVDSQTIRYTLGKYRYYRLTPRQAQDYLIAFDAGDTEGMAFSCLVGPPIFRRAAGSHGGDKNRRSGTHLIQTITDGESPNRVTVKGPTPRTDMKDRLARGRTRRRWFGRRVLRENQPAPNLPPAP